MSRRRTKQRRAALWRREWQRFYLAEAGDGTAPPYGIDAAEWLDLVPHMADYSGSLQRREETLGGLGLRWPQQAAAYWARLDAKDRLRPPADRERSPR